MEALLDVIETYPGVQVKLDVLTSGVGPITESEVTLANSFDGEGLSIMMVFVP